MLETSWQQEIGRRVRLLQHFVVGLVVPCPVFLGIMTLASGEPAGGLSGVILTWMAVGLGMAGVAARLILPGVIVSRGRQRIIDGSRRPPQPRGESPAEQAIQEGRAQVLERTGDAGKLYDVFSKRTYVAGAVLAIPAYAAVMWYATARSPAALIVAVVLMIGVATLFPTRSKVFHWIEDQLRLVEQARQSGRQS